MSTWTIVAIVVVAWVAVAIVMALVVGRAVKLRDEKERGPREIPDFVPDDSSSQRPGSDT